MKISFAEKPAKDSILVIPVVKKRKTTDAVLNKFLDNLAESEEFSGKTFETFFSFGALKPSWPKRLLLIGLGKEEKLSNQKILEVFGHMAKTLERHNPKKVALVFIEPLFKFGQFAAEGLSLSTYRPDMPYKTGKDLKRAEKQTIQELEIIGVKDKNIRDSFNKGMYIATAVNETRDWVNAPPNFANTLFFEKKARQLAEETGAELTILRNKELIKLGMGAFLAINRGSADEACLIIFDYCPRGANKKEPPIVLIGKGIVFDSGGYHLKPHGHIENMQSDKAGAAAVFGLLKLLPQTEIKKRIIIAAPFTENVIGPTTLKPSEIIKTYLGKTVEITNTDAEGRMILADAIAYTNKLYKPKCIIDIATLTGACVVALGDKYAGLFGNDKNLSKELRKAGQETDELLWPMPIHKTYEKQIRGYYADLQNAERESGAGASKGAAFLKEFVGKTSWAHLDIAGPSFIKDPKQYERKGATGFGIRLLLRFLENLR